jgi:hypothetical protein
MNKADREHIEKDVRAVEHAKNDQVAKEAGLLLRNDVYIASTHGKNGKKEALDLINRTNIYDRAENPNLPRVTLIDDELMPQFKSGTKIKYPDGRTVCEGLCGNENYAKPQAKAAETKPQEQKHPGELPPPGLVTEANR